jgi:hypothetical protein
MLAYETSVSKGTFLFLVLMLFVQTLLCRTFYVVVSTEDL